MLGQKQQDNAPAIPVDSLDTTEEPGRQSSPGGQLAWLPVVILLTVIGSLWFADLTRERGTTSGIVIDFAIALVTCTFTACLLAKSFLIYGAPGLLGLGCGTIVWGLAGAAATIVARQDASLGTTIYCTCMCLSASCHLTGAILLLRTRRPVSRKALWLPVTYALAVVTVVAVGLFASTGWIPSFFIPEQDAAPARQPSRILATGMFILVALLLGAGATKRHPASPLVAWYALVPGLIAAGVFGALLQSSPGGIFDWSGPSSQFLGSLYMLLIAVIASQQEARARESATEAALRKSDHLYHLLFDKMTEGFFIGEVVYDEEGKPYDYRHVHVNPGHERQTGFKRERVTGKTSRELFFPAPNPVATEKFLEAGHLGRSSHFEIFSQAMGKYLDIYAFPLEEGKFASLTIDITEHKQMMQALRASEQHLKAVVNGSSMPQFVIGRDHRIIYWNRAMEEYSGLQAVEMVGTTEPWRAFYKSERPCLVDLLVDGEMDRIEQLYAGKYNHSRLIDDAVEAIDFFPDMHGGTWLSFTAALVRNENGEIIGAVETMSDISERKQMEDALRESEHKLEDAQRIAHLGHGEYDADTDCITSSDETLRIFGVTPVERKICFARFIEMIHPDDREMLAHGVTEAFESGQNLDLEYRVVRPTGEVRFIHSRYAAAKEESGRTHRVFGTVLDITDRRLAEEALRRSEEKYRTIVDTAIEGIWALGPDGLTTFVNARMAKMLGYANEEMIGHPANDFMFKEDVHDHMRRVEERRQGISGTYERRFRRKDGQTVWTLVSAAPVFDEDRCFLGSFAMFTDITERMQMEQALRELNATLESKVVLRTAELEKRTHQLQQLTLQLAQAEDRERTRIGAILHEDFQQQIAGAKLHLSLLSKRTRDDPQQQEIIAKVDEILKDAIEQSRSLAHELSPAALSQNDLTEVLRWLAVRINAELGLRVRVEAQEGVVLESDALTVFLFRAVQEMLRNVVKHAKATDATIRTGCHGRYVCISVRDKGRGFTPTNLGETTGYGLMSIRERIEMLGGRLKIRSHKNLGTTLYLTVPNEAASATDEDLHEIVAQSK